MSKDEAINELRKAQSDDSAEFAHKHADEVLCKLLAALGYTDVVEEYKKVHKWYA